MNFSGTPSAFVRRGGLWVLAQGGLLLGVVAGAWIWPGGNRHVLLSITGLVLLALGAIVGLAGTVALGRNLTPFPQPASATRLVQSGVYRFIRHPLYTAVCSAALGWAILWGSWPALLVALVLAPFFDAKARREERWLREHFPEYTQYEQRVRRFIPGLY